jgi:2-dehydro-3-deoxyglucarate aldolase/4-hydroxy-2-oxoheptanedioate aldolase
MNLRENKLKKLLQGGGVALGCGLQGVKDAEIVYNIADAGADFVFIDLEHGALNLETAVDLLLHAYAAGVTPMIRIPDLQYAYVTRLLDNGANCLLLPHPREPAEVHRLIELAKYHPAGRRGWAMGQNGGSNFQNVTDMAAGAAWANEHLLLGLNIETKEAVENLDRMLIPGVDFVIVGFADLSQSYGLIGQFNHPVIQDAKVKVRKLCRERGIFIMDVPFTLDSFKPAIEDGAQMLLFGGTIGFIRNGVEQAAKKLREVGPSAR